MDEIRTDPNLIARCGLYCGACGAFRKGRCPGCRDNAKASWCKIRSCCAEHSYASCADCTEFANPSDCKKFNNFVAKAIGVVLNSNRQACIHKIRELGRDGYAAYMTKYGRQSLPRRGTAP
jgi:hypothetical protein